MRVVAAAALLAVAFAAPADEAAVRRLVELKLRDAKIESVQKTPYGGLYEVVVRTDQGVVIYYVDDRASVIIAGTIIDGTTGRNLTTERIRKLSAIRWDSLPFEWAVTTTRGTGRRKIAVFSDPNCPFCRRLEGDLAKLDDITVHIFPYPVLRPDSVSQTKSVWCSMDRAKAWNDLMLRGVQPQAPPDCDTPIEGLLKLGPRLGANSVPTWFLENGERYQGALPLEEVRRLLDAASSRR